MNTSRARRGRRALARPASRCDTAEAGEGGGGHWQCQGVETDEDLEESSAAEREVVGGLQGCSSCP